MIDVIYESAHKSFIVEYGQYAGNIMNQLANAIRTNSDVTSSIDSMHESSQTSINAFISKVVKDS